MRRVADAQDPGPGRRGEAGPGFGRKADDAGDVHAGEQADLVGVSGHRGVEAQAAQGQAEDPALQYAVDRQDGDALGRQVRLQRAPASLDQPPEGVVGDSAPVGHHGQLVWLCGGGLVNLLQDKHDRGPPRCFGEATLGGPGRSTVMLRPTSHEARIVQLVNNQTSMVKLRKYFLERVSQK